MGKSKLLAIAVTANVTLVLLFAYSNFSIWNELNHYQLIAGSLSPFSINFVSKSVVDGGLPLATGGLFSSPNYPFWLFFISTALNYT
jgi:hypothetical protein